jgi:hypothetical protein
MNIVQYIRDKEFSTRIIGGSDTEAIKRSFLNVWSKSPDGTVFIIPQTNPQTPEEAFDNDVYRFIYQIDYPPKFTVGNTTFIRKSGELELTDGVIDWDGFYLFREQILHLITEQEAIKIIDGWR